MSDISSSTPRSDAPPPLVLIGAHSRAGRAILRSWPGQTVVPVHRDEGAGVRVPDYSNVPTGTIPAGSLVVNCVGAAIGSEELLCQLNRNVALRWAEAAAAAGARQFIQLSSFSVYGRTERIGPDTPETPQTPYGRSKLAADRALLELASSCMQVTLLRIPMLFGDGPSKLAQFVRLVRLVGSVPRVSPPIERSMLSYDALAAAVLELAGQPVHGVAHVADPMAFTYELLRNRVERATGRALRRIPFPSFVIDATRWTAPSLHARLFASSLLDPSAALAFDVPPEATLEREIDRLARA